MIDPFAILHRAEKGEALSREALRTLLELRDPDGLRALFDCAYAVKTKHVGRVVYFRGLIECGNVCAKNCRYCGIRRGNRQVERFEMDEAEMVREALWAWEADYGSCVIQAGERRDEAFAEKIERVLRRIAEATAGRMGITISLGEQSEETYRRWREAGAHRYLLRIETSNPELYAKIHPPDHRFEDRLECLAALRRTGYQVGTGTMMGLPGQTPEDLADDVLFLKRLDVDMVGMGPYIPHRDTPMGREIPLYSAERKRAALGLALKMIAVTRIVLKDVNIAAATALQALEPDGREQALRCGANVVMPNLTETEYRSKYSLYEGKPCTEENSAACRGCLLRRIEAIGERVGFGRRGDAPHYRRRNGSGAR